jgi:curved DNA-binding protein CbpA
MDAKPQELRRAWKHLLQNQRKHPDLGGSEDEASLINEAYAVLKDPTRRTAYDRLYLAYVAGADSDGVNGNAPAKNRRRVKRVEYVNEVYIQKQSAEASTPAQTQDISLYGLRLRTTHKLKSHDMLQVSFAQDPGFVIQGTVQWHRMIPQLFGHPIYEAGLEFKGMQMERFVAFLERSGLASQVSD